MPFVNSTSEVQTSQVLSTFATEYQPRGLIGGRLLTRIPVAKTAGSYRTRNKSNMLRNDNVEIGDVGLPGLVQAGYSSASFACENYAAEAHIPVVFEEVADDSLNLRMDATREVKMRLAVAEESRIATIITTTSNYASGNYATLAGTDQWSDYANSDPFDDIRTYLLTIYASPDARKVGWCGVQVWQKLQDHPAIVERVKYVGSMGGAGSPAMVTQQAFAALFGLDDFLVSDLLTTSTNPGQTATYSYMWGKDFGVVAVEPSQSTMFLGFGARFVYQDVVISEVFDSRPGLKGVTMIKGAHSVDEVVAASDAGFVLKAAVA